jgi:hypothetical protein
MLTCTDAGGNSISASQVFTAQDAVMPSFTTAFQNGNILIDAVTGALAPTLTYSLAAAVVGTDATTQANTTYHHSFIDTYQASATAACVKAVYSGFGGNPLNTVCREACVQLPASNCTDFHPYIAGSAFQQGQPSVLTAVGAFSPVVSSASYTYAWRNGATTDSIHVNPTTVATYTVTVTSDRGCVAVDSLHLPTWKLQAMDSICISNASAICIPLICNKVIVNGTGLRFKFKITGPATIVSVPAINYPYTTIDLNSAVLTGISYAHYDTVTNETTISIMPDAGTRINTGLALPQEIGCLHLSLTATARVSDTIWISGTVEENYAGGVYQQFGLFKDSILVTGGALETTLFYQNSNTPLTANTTITATDASCNSASDTATLLPTNAFSLPLTPATTHFKVERIVQEPVSSLWYPGTNPNIIGSDDAAITLAMSAGDTALLHRFPSIYQILSMDADGNGRIGVDDALYIMNRSTGDTTSFPNNRHWSFFDPALLTSNSLFTRSTSFPLNDNSGFCIDNLPVVNNCMPLPQAFSCNTISTTLQGVLIGNVRGLWTPANEPLYRAAMVSILTFDIPSHLTADVQGYYTIPILVSEGTHSTDIIIPNVPTTVSDIKIEANNQNGFSVSNNFQASLQKFRGGAFRSTDLTGHILNLKIKTTDITVITTLLTGATVLVNGAPNGFVVPTENTTASSSQITLFPNPTSGTVTISTKNEDLLGSNMTVYDALGRLLQTLKLQHTQQVIDMNSYAAGVYFIKIQGETVKIVKEGI